MKRGAESLVDVTPGETVKVRQVIFDSLREYCAELGVHKGDRLTLLEGGLSNLLLEEEDGRLVCCPCEFARFIEVARERRRAGRSGRAETGVTHAKHACIGRGGAIERRSG